MKPRQPANVAQRCTTARKGANSGRQVLEDERTCGDRSAHPFDREGQKRFADGKMPKTLPSHL